MFVGKKQLIKGMDKALVGMCVNERRLVKIPPDLAYGKQGYGAYVSGHKMARQAAALTGPGRGGSSVRGQK